MKPQRIRFPFRRSAALGLALLLALALAYPGVSASAGETILTVRRELAEGFSYVNTVSNHPASGRMESHALELSAQSDVRPIFMQSTDKIYATADISGAVERATAAGYHVLGAVNADFFAMATGVPMGIAIENGVLKSSSEDGRSAVVVSGGRVLIKEEAKVSMSLVNSRGEVLAQPHYLNKTRTATGGLYLLNSDFSPDTIHTGSASGWAVRFRQESPEALTASSRLQLSVTELVETSEELTVGPGEYLLTADTRDQLESVYRSFRRGETVTLVISCEDPDLAAAQWASGAGDIMVDGGVMTDPTAWAYTKYNAKDPRTALGLRADGSVLLYAVDGRRDGVSAGLTQVDLAGEMIRQGCVRAVNLDGGGSTTMSVWVPGQPEISVANRPSDGKPRKCATYMLFVTDDPGDGQPRRLVLPQDGAVVLAGSTLPLDAPVILDSGLNILEGGGEDASFSSSGGLGYVEGSVYIAGTTPGTDTLVFQGGGLSGSAQVHIVGSLTELSLYEKDGGEPLREISLRPGKQAALDAIGTYWSRAALRSQSGVSWSVEGDVGSVDGEGVFTASMTAGAEGSLTAAAGGRTVTVPVKLGRSHLDVPVEHWAYDAVEYLYDRELSNGISMTEYGASEEISRGDFMTLLYRAADEPAVEALSSFDDVPEDTYYAPAVTWGERQGISNGTGGGKFEPASPVTRQEAFTFLGRAASALGVQTPEVSAQVLEAFTDASSLEEWASIHAATLAACHVLTGSALRPGDNLRRDEMAAMLYRLLRYDAAADVTGIQLDQTQLTLLPGAQAQVTATLTPADYPAAISWSVTEGKEALGLSQDGVVTNLNTTGGAMEAVVTASCGSCQATLTVYCPAAVDVGVVAVKETALNVRSGPGKEYPVVGALEKGERVLLAGGEESGFLPVWYRTGSGAGAFGYVSAQYIAVE